jgi:hypothetical protein
VAMGWIVRIQFPAGFLRFAAVYRPTLEPHVQWVLRLFYGVRRLECEADQSRLCSTEVKTMDLTSLPHMFSWHGA